MNHFHSNAAAITAIAFLSLSGPVFSAGGVAYQELPEGAQSPDDPKASPSTGKKPEKPEYKGPGIGESVKALDNDSSVAARGKAGAYGADPGVLDELKAKLEGCNTAQQESVNAGLRNRTRRSHPELAVSDCIDLDPEPSGFGGFINRCDHEIVFSFCAFRPKKDAWTEAFDCEKTKGGTETIGPRERIAAHTKGAEMIYWGACKFPQSLVSDTKFSLAEGLQFRCSAWDAENMGLFGTQVGTYERCKASDVEELIYADLKREEEEKTEKAKQERLARQRDSDAEREREESPARQADSVPTPAPSRNGSNQSARYSSVCHRNSQKILDRVSDQGAKYGATPTDIVLRDLMQLDLKILKPCIAYDADSRNAYEDSSEKINNINQLCAGSHGQLECMRWGGWPDMAKDYYAKYEAEVQAALADPNYSADLGAVRYGPDNHADAESNESRPTATALKTQECKKGLADLEKEGEAINRRRPANASLIADMQVAMYLVLKNEAFLKAANCQSTSLSAKVADFQRAYEETRTACQASVSDKAVCVPKLAW